MPETTEKLTRLRAWMKQHKLGAVVFATRSNFAWLSGGGDNHVVSQLEEGVGALAVTMKGAFLIANRIECDRLHTEEGLSPFTAKTFPWIETLDVHVAKVLGPLGKSYVSDLPALTGGKALPADFLTLRAELSDSEIRRYKSLGRDCALVIETVARSLNPGDSEQLAEADLARHLLARGIQPFVLLVAFDQRILRYRHATPTANHLRNHAMLVVCGRKGGLIASLTRFIHFGKISPDLLKKHESACRVEAALWQATVPGVTWGAALTAGLKQYAAEGAKDEWLLHHQGGPTGYAGRDFCVIPTEKRKVIDRQAVAWNPSITGTKTEDTYIIDGAARHVITAASPTWPTVNVSLPGGFALTRPAILVR